MILITGGLGFIGSNLINKINGTFLVIEDKHNIKKKIKYIKNKKKIYKIILYENLQEIEIYKKKITRCIHLGAISNTLNTNKKKINEINFEFSKKIYNFCNKNNIKFIYASSASVYGDGRKKFDDSQNKNYKPLNFYAKSKLKFDKYILKNIKTSKLNILVGLRFFNVYGINEIHKAGYSSPIYKFFLQIKKSRQITLYDDFKKKRIERDFIYIDDVTKIILKIFKMKKIKSILNVGTGKSTSFYQVARLMLQYYKNISILTIQLPSNLKKNYQYFTRSNNKKFYKIIKFKNFTPINIGIRKYLKMLDA